MYTHNKPKISLKETFGPDAKEIEDILIMFSNIGEATEKRDAEVMGIGRKTVNRIMELDANQIEFCKALGMKRSGSMNHADTKHSANFFKDKPAWHRHFLGVMGEFAYGAYSGYPIDNETIGRGDTGTDFLDGTDVKSSDSISKPNLILRPDAIFRKKPKSYVLAWIRVPVVILVGRITWENVIDVMEERKYDHGVAYFIDNRFLRPM